MPLMHGYEIRTSLYLTEDGPPVTVHRSWRERLVPHIICRFPLLAVDWRPWVASVTTVPKVPRRNGVIIDGVLYLHPAMLQTLTQQLMQTLAPYERATNLTCHQVRQFQKRKDDATRHDR